MEKSKNLSSKKTGKGVSCAKDLASNLENQKVNPSLAGDKNNLEMEKGFQDFFKELYNLCFGKGIEDPKYKAVADILWPLLKDNVTKEINFRLSMGRFKYFDSAKKMFEYFTFMAKQYLSRGKKDEFDRTFASFLQKDAEYRKTEGEEHIDLTSIHRAKNIVSRMEQTYGDIMKNKGQKSFDEVLKAMYSPEE